MQYSCISAFTNRAITSSHHVTCDASMNALWTNCKHRCCKIHLANTIKPNTANGRTDCAKCGRRPDVSAGLNCTDPSTHQPFAAHVHCTTSYFSFHSATDIKRLEQRLCPRKHESIQQLFIWRFSSFCYFHIMWFLVKTGQQWSLDTGRWPVSLLVQRLYWYEHAKKINYWLRRNYMPWNIKL